MRGAIAHYSSYGDTAALHQLKNIRHQANERYNHGQLAPKDASELGKILRAANRLLAMSDSSQRYDALYEAFKTYTIDDSANHRQQLNDLVFSTKAMLKGFSDNRYVAINRLRDLVGKAEKLLNGRVAIGPSAFSLPISPSARLMSVPWRMVN